MTDSGATYEHASQPGARPLVSVVVPVFNTAAYLRDCVDSVLNQTYRNVEVILIDDGSTDDSPDICDAYADADPRVRVSHQRNAGLSAARNTGMDQASGARIMFLDSDDWLDSRCIEVLSSLLDVCEAEVALCGTARAANPGDHHAPMKADPAGVCVSGDAFLRNSGAWDPVHPVSAWAKLIDRRLLSGFSFPLGRLHEDVFVTHEVLHRARRVALTREVLHHYRTRDGSITSGVMSMKSASDKARGHLEKAASLLVYGLGEVAGLEFRRGFGWHLRVRAAAGRGPSGFQTELSEQRALIEHVSSQLELDARTRLTLLSYSALPLTVARSYSYALRLSTRGAGAVHPIDRQ